MPRRSPPDPDRDQIGPFPEAQSIHERILDSPEDSRDGWVEQAQFREQYDLPPFRPPRFVDDNPVHPAVERLEADLDTELTFISPEGAHDDWHLAIDGERALTIDRYRDDAANTIVGMTAATFASQVREAYRDLI